jgi:hypothetical protein
MAVQRAMTPPTIVPKSDWMSLKLFHVKVTVDVERLQIYRSLTSNPELEALHQQLHREYQRRFK